jgi:hypothetical protein
MRVGVGESGGPQRVAKKTPLLLGVTGHSVSKQFANE